MKYNNVIFYNGFHNGDVHLSRTFVKYIVDYCFKNNAKCYYIHNNKHSLIKDIDNLNIIIKYPNLSNNELAFIKNNDLYINTWYAAGNHYYHTIYECSFNCYYHLFNDVLIKFFGFDLSYFSSNKEDFFPDIDFKKYNTLNIDSWISNNKNYKVLLCNCDTLSGQSNNFDFNPIIERLSDKYKDIDWIITDLNKYKINKNNVFYSEDIIQNKGDDLNENGYLSCFCDYLIGRCSGAYSFFYNKNNFFKSNKNILSFSTVCAPWYVPSDFKLNYSCNVIDYKKESFEEVFSVIENNIVR